MFPVETHLDADRVKEDCPWLEGKLLNEHELLQPRLTRYRTESLLKKQYATCAKQVKDLLKKHGAADTPVSVDYASPGLVHALEAEGLKIVDGVPGSMNAGWSNSTRRSSA